MDMQTFNRCLCLYSPLAKHNSPSPHWQVYGTIICDSLTLQEYTVGLQLSPLSCTPFPHALSFPLSCTPFPHALSFPLSLPLSCTPFPSLMYSFPSCTLFPSLMHSLSLSHAGDSLAEEKWFCGEAMSCQVCQYTMTQWHRFDTQFHYRLLWPVISAATQVFAPLIYTMSIPTWCVCL